MSNEYRRSTYETPVCRIRNTVCLIVRCAEDLELEPMARSKLTEKYQVTIPKEIREKVHVSPGEVIVVEAISQDEIRLKRYPSVSDPLDVLIGKKQSRRSIPIEELEEKIESR